MEVTREVVNKAPYIITDHMYNGDNVGINLDLLNQAKTHKKLDVSAIPIDYSPVSINNTNNKISIATDLKFIDNNVAVVAETEYASNKTIDIYNIEDKVFANDIINTCIIDKKDIKNMPCYKALFEQIKQKACENALQEDFLVKTPELKFKCYIYSDNMELLGVANRLLATSISTRYTLGEYVGKKLTEFLNRNLIIDICINNEVTLQMTNVKLTKALESSLAYATLDVEHTMIKRLTENYENINIKTPPGFNFPEIKSHYTIENYYEQLLVGNDPNNIERFFKDNKPNTNVMINLNKYLIV